MADTAPERPDNLSAWLDDAETRHGDEPATIAAALMAVVPNLPTNAQAARALRLAEHVGLGHLGDADWLAAFANSLPAALATAEATAPALQRLRWALAMVQAAPGEPWPEAPPEAVRWRALPNVVLALAAQGRFGVAGALLAADEEAARALGQADAAVAYASAANNVAGELQTSGPRAHAERDALMLQAAAIARRAWAHAGNWRHVERAEYRLALCHAVAGDGAAAVQHAGLCLAGCQAAGEAADAVEHFFAHEALARAHLADGNAATALQALAQMQALLPQIDEADGLRAWCAEALAAVPSLPAA